MNGKPAKVLSTDGGGPFKFEAQVDLDAGANTVVVEAKDGQNNTSTKTYAVTTAGISKTYEYDANGNLRFEKQPNGTVIREYRWDQQNRLVKELHGMHESAYEYDGASRRWRITEKENGTQTKQETFVWCGSRICQKRNGSTVVRSYFGQGFEESGTTDYFYTRDHLGSVREVVGSDGTTVASRLSYDPWGKVTESGSGALSDFTYTGHHYDRPTGLNLAQYRAYDPQVGRWISRDPAGLAGGLNLYGYANGNPIRFYDRTGLTPEDRYPGMPQDEIDASNEGAGWSIVALLVARFPALGFLLGSGATIETDKDLWKVPLLGGTCGGGGAAAEAEPLASFGPNTVGAAERSVPDLTLKMLSRSRRIATGRDIRDVDRLVAQYGGKARDWVKKSTERLEIDGMPAEIHWYEARGIGRVERKIKWLDE